MGQVREEGRSLVGRIGFSAGNLAELWDEERKDFREQILPSGLTSPFAIDPSGARAAFQLRPGMIRVRSFTGALQALMNEASPNDRWRVYQDVEPMSFATWVERTDRVTTLRIRVERPNPHYGDRERVRALVEGANARMADLAWTADSDSLDGLDVSEPFVREAIEHSAKYGSYSASGERDDTPTAWSSEQGAAFEQIEVSADPVTREVPSSALREQLGDEQAATSDAPDDVPSEGSA